MSLAPTLQLDFHPAEPGLHESWPRPCTDVLARLHWSILTARVELLDALTLLVWAVPDIRTTRPRARRALHELSAKCARLLEGHNLSLCPGPTFHRIPLVLLYSPASRFHAGSSALLGPLPCSLALRRRAWASDNRRSSCSSQIIRMSATWCS